MAVSKLRIMMIFDLGLGSANMLMSGFEATLPGILFQIFKLFLISLDIFPKVVSTLRIFFL